MPSDEEKPPASQAQSSQSWRQAAYASQAAAIKAKGPASTPASTSKTRSSTSQKATQAKSLLKSNSSPSKSSQGSSGSHVEHAGHHSLSSSGPSSTGLAGLPLYSDKATGEIRALTSKKGMKSEQNPITHSRLAERTQHYVSSATGHQVANHMMASFPVTGWRDVRQAKLREQAAESSSAIFAGVTAYLNGYQGDDKINLDITRKIQGNGGKVNYLYSKSQCTHIISSRALSGKKNQEWLVDKKKNIVKLVRPEWVYDSVAAGKRLAESKYPVFSDASQGTILAAFGRRDGAGSSAHGAQTVAEAVADGLGPSGTMPTKAPT